MTLDPLVVVAIIGMSVATYATRAGGYLLFRVMPTPPLLRLALSYIPGALFVSYVVPALMSGGVQQWVGAVVTGLLMLATRQLAVAIVGGTAAAWVVWSV